MQGGTPPPLTVLDDRMHNAHSDSVIVSYIRFDCFYPANDSIAMLHGWVYVDVFADLMQTPCCASLRVRFFCSRFPLS